jgi:hypothetical protein
MNSRFLVVETSLNRTEFRWKWLRFLRWTSLLGTLLSLGVLFLGGAILCGWVVSKPLVVTLLAVGGGVVGIIWVAVTLGVLANAPDRARLASALEGVDRRLMDRLNTLLFLERRRGGAPNEAFALRIAKQTQQVLAQGPLPSPFPKTRSLVQFLLFLIALTLTILLYQLYNPWERLVTRPSGGPGQLASAKTAPELSLPPTNNVEQNRAWGEVRITDPGSDLKVTKVDVVPLQIEAAAAQPLKGVDWFTTLNSAPEVSHPLPPPSEPRYAVYQPTLYLDEFHLSDWDVMTYYAKAHTDQTNSYGSEVYFLEVRPFREDIAKMPGGEGGQAYQCLNEITTLINWQQHVIRQTHRHVVKPPEQEELKTQDRNKLADAESDLGTSAKHLYAKMATEMENKPIGPALDSLAKAEKSLGGASQGLRKNTMPQAQDKEREALADLVAMRKMFQKAVSDNPDAFTNESNNEPPPPVAESSRKLEKMAEFRNEARAAQDFVKQALQQQKDLEEKSRTASRNDYTQLAGEEQELQKSLEDFQAQHPQAFKSALAESRQTQESMSKAAESLHNRRGDSRNALQKAAQDMENLGNAMQSRSAAQQLADAYKLKQMLDHQISELQEGAQPDSKASGDQLNKTARDASQTINQLAKTAEQEPTRDSFGQPLRDSLSGQNKVDLETKLKQLQMADPGADRQQRAGEAGQALAKVSKAFEQSQPQSLQASRNNDSLKPSEHDSFSQGMAELESLIRQLENRRSVSREDQAKEGRQALLNLQSGLRAQYGDNDRGNQLLVQLQQLLRAETPLEVADLKKLMDQLQNFSVETSERLAKQEDQPQLDSINPSRLPPAYRGRIQKYFQKLSEK